MEDGHSKDEEKLEKNLKEDAKRNVKRLLESALKQSDIFISDKNEGKKAFLSNEIFNKRSDVDKPFKVNIKDNNDVVVIPVGSRVDGTKSQTSDFDYLVVLDIKSDDTLKICSKSVTEPCFLRVDVSDFPKSMRSSFFENIDESYQRLREDDSLKESTQENLSRLPNFPIFGYKADVGWRFDIVSSALFGLSSIAKWVSYIPSYFSERNPEEHGPATTLLFTFAEKKRPYTIDLVPVILVNNTKCFTNSGMFTENRCRQNAFLNIGSFFVTQRRGVSEYMAAFNLSELLLMDKLRSSNSAAIDAFKTLKDMKLELFFGKDTDNVFSSYVLKTLVLTLATDKSLDQMKKTEIVVKVLNELKSILSAKSKRLSFQHLWFPGQNVFALKRHQGPYDQKSLDHVKAQIDENIEKIKFNENIEEIKSLKPKM